MEKNMKSDEALVKAHIAENAARLNTNPLENRLGVALDLLGVTAKVPKHVRHVLVRAIAQFAVFNKDSVLESQCETMLKSIESE
jgi:hypothetical protein